MNSFRRYYDGIRLAPTTLSDDTLFQGGVDLYLTNRSGGPSGGNDASISASAIGSVDLDKYNDDTIQLFFPLGKAPSGAVSYFYGWRKEGDTFHTIFQTPTPPAVLTWKHNANALGKPLEYNTVYYIKAYMTRAVQGLTYEINQVFPARQVDTSSNHEIRVKTQARPVVIEIMPTQEDIEFQQRAMEALAALTRRQEEAARMIAQQEQQERDDLLAQANARAAQDAAVAQERMTPYVARADEIYIQPPPVIPPTPVVIPPSPIVPVPSGEVTRYIDPNQVFSTDFTDEIIVPEGLSDMPDLLDTFMDFVVTYPMIWNSIDPEEDQPPSDVNNSTKQTSTTNGTHTNITAGAREAHIDDPKYAHDERIEKIVVGMPKGYTINVLKELQRLKDANSITDNMLTLASKRIVTRDDLNASLSNLEHIFDTLLADKLIIPRETITAIESLYGVYKRRMAELEHYDWPSIIGSVTIAASGVAMAAGGFYGFKAHPVPPRIVQVAATSPDELAISHTTTDIQTLLTTAFTADEDGLITIPQAARASARYKVGLFTRELMASDDTGIETQALRMTAARAIGAEYQRVTTDDGKSALEDIMHIFLAKDLPPPPQVPKSITRAVADKLAVLSDTTIPSHAFMSKIDALRKASQDYALDEDVVRRILDLDDLSDLSSLGLDPIAPVSQAVAISVPKKSVIRAGMDKVGAIYDATSHLIGLALRTLLTEVVMKKVFPSSRKVQSSLRVAIGLGTVAYVAYSSYTNPKQFKTYNSIAEVAASTESIRMTLNSLMHSAFPDELYAAIPIYARSASTMFVVLPYTDNITSVFEYLYNKHHYPGDKRSPLGFIEEYIGQLTVSSEVYMDLLAPITHNYFVRYIAERSENDAVIRSSNAYGDVSSVSYYWEKFKEILPIKTLLVIGGVTLVTTGVGLYVAFGPRKRSDDS